jgi:phosphatidylserine decarboxylase
MIARDGWTFILIGLVLTVVALWAATKWDSRTLFGLSILFALLTLFVAYFFRDPERAGTREPDVLLAPADGRIVQIDTLPSHQFVGPNTIQVSIFLSIFDVHVNRIPVTGEVDYVKYHPGKFMAAYHDKASLENEQTEIGMTTDAGRKIAFKQIAGLIARRIVCRLNDGDRVNAGDRFGMIKFGSRVDILMPSETRLNVKMGDHVKGGETVMGYLKTIAALSSSKTDRGKVDGNL